MGGGGEEVCVILYVRVVLLAQIFSLRNAVLFESLTMFTTGWERVLQNQSQNLFQPSFQQTRNIPIIPIYKQIIAVLISGG